MGLDGASSPRRQGTNLSGRTACVTGGGGPLGRALCTALAGAGARVVVVDVHDATETVRSLAPVEGEQPHVAIETDLMLHDGLDLVERTMMDLGECHVLVNNAALTGAAGLSGYAVPFSEQSDEAFAAACWLNLTVPFSLTRRLHPLLAESGSGSVVNVSSIYGLVGPNMALYEGTSMGNPAAYAATKGGLGQLTRYLATVLAPEVRVNAFAPGGIQRGQDSAFITRYSRLTPLGRMAHEEDFEGTVLFLAGDDSAFVTGQVLAVDGGWTAW